MASPRAQRAQREELIAAAHTLAARSWVANHDGNLSLRIDAGRFLITPTATAKAAVSDATLIEVDAAGTRLSGSAKPFGELGMHLAVFEQRDDVAAVIHAHPPYATALACSGSTIIQRPFIAEAIVSLGPLIPTVPFAAPGPDACTALGRVASTVDAALLASHGVFTWGPSLELAYLRMELVEHLARIATLAQATGGVQPLPESILPTLLASRAKAGLGKAADKAMEFAPAKVVACAPAPHARVSTMSHGSGANDQLADIIRDELSKLLRE